MNDVIERIGELSGEFEPEIIALRRHFHSHPELSWQEERTTDRVQEELLKLGIETVHRGYGGTSSGLIADIQGGAPGKCVALRADMDALPVTEENDVEYRSRNEGVMHACGHDAHTAALLGAAKILMRIRSELRGTVRLLFQPAEEAGDRSGARAMVEEGALRGVDAAFGLHVASIFPAGKLLYRHGPCYAACDVWNLTIEGKGGHGSAPELAIDPTPAAFQIGSAFQTVISREVSPRDTAVLSVGCLETSSKAFNIIPERVKMVGTVRTFERGVQDAVESGMRRLSSDIATAFRCRAELDYHRSAAATVNDPAMTDLLIRAGTDLFGPEAMVEAPLNMGSEDFSCFAEAVPSTYLQLGTAAPDRPGTHMPHHSAKFDLDEAQLKRAAAIHAAFAWTYLSR